MKTPRNWKVKFINVWEDIYAKSFQDKWLNWIANGIDNHVFFHPFLSMAWIETYRQLRDLTPLFCIGESGSETAFLPLVLWRQNWKNAFRRVILPVGYSDYDYHDPVVKGQVTEDNLSGFFQSLNETLASEVIFDFFDLTGIRTQFEGNNWSIEDDTAPYCDLRSISSPENYLITLKTSLRCDIRRQIRRISNLGTIDLHRYSSINAALEVLPSFLDLHSRRWPSSYKAPGFHRNIILSGLERGIVDFTSLMCGDRILSYHLGFALNGRYYYYLPVSDPKYENLSPGKIHLYMLIESAIEKNYLVFDYLRGSESYKSGWTDKTQPLYRFSFSKPGFGPAIRNLAYSLKKKIF